MEEEEKSIDNILNNIKQKMKSTGISITSYSKIKKVSEKIFYKISIDRRNDNTFLEEIISYSFPALYLLNNWIEQNPCDKVIIQDFNSKSRVPIEHIQYPFYPKLNGRTESKFYFYHINIDRVLYIYILKDEKNN